MTETNETPETDYSASTVHPSSPLLLIEQRLVDRIREILSLNEPVHELTVIGYWDSSYDRAGLRLGMWLAPNGAKTVGTIVCDTEKSPVALEMHGDAVEVLFVEDADGLASVALDAQRRLHAACQALHAVRVAIEEEGDTAEALDVLQEYVPGEGASLEYASAMMEVLDYEGVWLDLQPFPLGRLFLRALGEPVSSLYLADLTRAGDL